MKTENSVPKVRAGAKCWQRHLYVQVLIGVLLGVAVGASFPEFGKALKPLGDGFIKLVKMMIGPIIFCTIVHGIASMTDVRKLGRVGIKALVYFEVVSTFALALGLVVVNVLQPGAGFGASTPGDSQAVQGYVTQAHSLDTVPFLLNIIPHTLFSAFAEGNLLQVLLVAGLASFAIKLLGENGRPVLRAVEQGSQLCFAMMRVVVKLAPIGAFGGMAYTVGGFGLAALKSLAALMAGFYATAALFVFIVLGFLARACGFSIVRFLAYIKEELLLVLGTSSSETALPGIIKKMGRLGCAESTVGLVIPTGYSFNLDGTNIYMTMATVFLAQATHTPLSLGQQITLLLVAMLCSKGASGVTGAGFVTLAATLSVVPAVPISSLAILVGIDRFMSECRALTNLIGNSVATVVISRWEAELTAGTLNKNLAAGLKPGGAE
jgi:aerobic C4-dicarboxylate transport protein